MSVQDQYLRNNLSRYKYPDKAKGDIQNALRQYVDLRPIMENFTFNTGETRQLMALTGTIPVTYQNNTYNIPICTYLFEDHPFSPPMVFVRPTSTMQVKPGQHVDSNGKIYLPYLHEWSYPASDISGLIGIMRIHFSEQPPVFARLNPSVASNIGMASGHMSTPPYPTYNAATPYPSVGHVAMPQPMLPPSNMAAMGNVGNAYRPPMGQQGAPMSTSGVNPAWGGVGSGQAWTTSGAGGQLSDDHMLMSLRSAVEDKMRRRIRDTVDTHRAELEVSRRQGEELQRGRAKLEDYLKRIEAERIQLTAVTSELKARNAELLENLRLVQQDDRIDVDAAVDAGAPLYRQLLNTYAEEQALEDAIYYLLEALRKNVVDCDTFVKSVRELSRRQFIARATVNKCREKAGLPEQ